MSLEGRGCGMYVFEYILDENEDGIHDISELGETKVPYHNL